MSETEVGVREYFIANNPLPGAIWNGNRLINPNHIIPDRYGPGDLAYDQRAFRAFLSTIAGKCPQLVGDCIFNGHGNPAQLVTTFKEKFKLSGTRLELPDSTVRFRCIRQLEPGFTIRGAIGLLGEYPRKHF